MASARGHGGAMAGFQHLQQQQLDPIQPRLQAKSGLSL
jgi:hypothetical protein